MTEQEEPPLTLSPHHREALKPYLPPPQTVFLKEPNSSSPTIYPLPHPTTAPPLPSSAQTETGLPWVTLTYATSLDSRISLAPGTRTALSGQESKAMTHYLRVCHDGILIGVGTAEADDPGLRSRFLVSGEGQEDNGEEEGLRWQPRPFILDPKGRWTVEGSGKLFGYAGAGKGTENRREKKIGRAPWWVVSEGVEFVGENSTSDSNSTPSNEQEGEVERKTPEVDPRLTTLSSVNGQILRVGTYTTKEEGVEWEKILRAMWATGVRSVMIEGGARVINDLLRERNQWLIKSVIVTVAPVYLGEAGVEVAPEREGRPLRLRDVKWLGMGEDVVMGGFLGEEGS